MYKYQCALRHKRYTNLLFLRSNMDYSKIRLGNERNEHVTKRLNRLSTWNFFRVLYRDSFGRLLGFNILILLCLAPIFIVMLLGSYNLSALQQTLPTLNNLGFSTGVWTDVADYYSEQAMHSNIQTALFAGVGSLLITLMLSGGLAVIRDAFWTGKLKTVGVFKSMGKGIKANIFYAFVANVIISASVVGIYVFCVWAQNALPLWATIIIAILLSIIALLVGVYLAILCSVSVTYKQSVRENLDDSWRLMWMNVLPNIVNFMLALLPIPLFFIFSGSILQMFYLALVLMFGGMYFPLVWQTHMMKTFALFHPVDTKKKNKQPQHQQPVLAEVSQEVEPIEPATDTVAETATETQVEETAEADEEQPKKKKGKK